MRILVHTIFYRPDLTGVAKYTADMCEWLAMRGHEVAVIAPPPYYPQWRIPSEYRNRCYWSEDLGGVRVRRAPIWLPRKPGGWSRVLYGLSYAVASLPPLLREVLRKPDVVLVIEPSFLNSPAAWLLARVSGARAWVHIQDFEIDLAFALGQLRRGRKVFSRIESWMLQRFDAVSSISPRMLRKAAAKGIAPDRLMLVPNWFDPSIFPLERPSSLRRKLGIPPDEKIALFAGSLGAKQNLEAIVAAARSLSGAPIRFVICGDGPAADALKASAAGVPNLVFLPLQPAEEVNELFNLADVHLLPQRAEAADSVVPSKLTAMLASGRPVIAVTEPGSELGNILEGCGQTVPFGDINAFTLAIRDLAQDSSRRASLGQHARETAERFFSRDGILGGLEIELLRAHADAQPATAKIP